MPSRTAIWPSSARYICRGDAAQTDVQFHAKIGHVLPQFLRKRPYIVLGRKTVLGAHQLYLYRSHDRPGLRGWQFRSFKYFE
jgi:hypothetical protein